MADSALALLAEARKVLDRYMFEGDTCRDDIAEVCQKIDDVLHVPAERQVRSSGERAAA